MKKLLIVLLALTVVGIFAFAEDAPASVSIGAWGRGWINPIASDGTDSIVGAGPGWSGNGPRVGVEFKGNSANMGFDWNPGVSNSGMTAVCDQAKIWAKLSPMFTVQVGQVQGDVLRGKLDDFGDILPTDGKDNIFARFYPVNGILLDITPVDGVYIGAALDTNGFTLAKDAYKAIQVGAGYVIPNVGHARVQYIGEGGPKSPYSTATAALDKATAAAEAAAKAYAAAVVKYGAISAEAFAAATAASAAEAAASKAAEDLAKSAVGGKVSEKASGAIQVAFAYTALEGLLIDAGVTIPTVADNQYKATVAGSYSKDALSTYERVDTTFGGKTYDKFTADVAAQVFYTVAAPVAVGVELAFTGMSNVDSAYDAKTLDIYPVVKFGYSNGYLKAGFDYKAGLDDQDATYALPIQLEYWF